MRALLDVNVLIAMADEEHIHFERVRRWWAGNRTYGWASCPFTENGLLRIVSQPNYDHPVSVITAFGLLSRAIAQSDHAFWPDDISLLDEDRFDRSFIRGPKQLADVYLLALAVKNDGCLATLDRSIPLGAVRRAEPRHLAVIE